MIFDPLLSSLTKTEFRNDRLVHYSIRLCFSGIWPKVMGLVYAGTYIILRIKCVKVYPGYRNKSKSCCNFFICLVKLNLLIVRTFLKSKVYKTLMDMDSSVVIAGERGVQEDQMVMETKQ